MLKVRHTLLSASLLLASTHSLFAQGIFLNHDDLRQHLNWLNQQGVIQLSTSTWPLSGTAIEEALQHAQIRNPTQQQVIDSVQSILQQQQSTLHASLYAGSDLDEKPLTFANADQTAQFKATLQGNAGGEQWDGRLNVNIEQKQRIDFRHNVNFEGSYLAGKFWNQWIIAGQIPTWWGSGIDGSLIRGDASRPVYGITMQRDSQKPFESKWLSWLGTWQYQAFAGRLDDYHAVPNTQLLGLRVTVQPTSYLELGGTRTLQIGGDGRPHSAKAYANALIGRDNHESNDERSASNQLAGIDFRLKLQPLLNMPASIYGQMIGEDEAGKLPYKWLYQAGFDVATQLSDKPLYLYAEWANTKSDLETLRISYAHSAYTDGYYQHGYSLGHGIGSDGEMYSIGGALQLDPKNTLKTKFIHADVNQSNLKINKAFAQHDRIQRIALDWIHQFPLVQTSLQTWFNKSRLYGNDIGVGLKIDIASPKK